jgi:TolB protein
MDADGSNVRRFTMDPGPGSIARWSPDGSQLAFVSNRDGDNEIYVMRADGSDVRRITNDPRENGYPRWRPDGGAIAHTAGSFQTDKWTAMLTDADGSTTTTLADSTDSGNVAWSPDGQSLLFGRYLKYGDNGGEDSRLFVLNVATGNTRRVR